MNSMYVSYAGRACPAPTQKLGMMISTNVVDDVWCPQVGARHAAPKGRDMPAANGTCRIDTTCGV